MCKDEMNVWRLRTVGCELHYRGCGEQSSSTEWGAGRHESDATKLHADIVQDSHPSYVLVGLFEGWRR